MTLTRKGSRRIVVDGISYRWLIRRKETWNDIHDEMATGVFLRVAYGKLVSLAVRRSYGAAS